MTVILHQLTATQPKDETLLGLELHQSMELQQELSSVLRRRGPTADTIANEHMSDLKSQTHLCASLVRLVHISQTAGSQRNGWPTSCGLQDTHYN